MKYFKYFKSFKPIILKNNFISPVKVPDTLFFTKHLYSTMADENVQGASLQTVIHTLTSFAPLNLGESWDNIGLLVEPSTPTIIKKIILTNDLTEDVMDEAIEKNAHMIISYHPPIFAKINRITSRTWKERIIAKCLEHRIAVFSPHTSWDCVKDGVADWLIRALPINSVAPIHPHDKQDSKLNSFIGSGRIGTLKSPITVQKAIDYIKKQVNLDHVRVALGRGKTLDSLVNTVAVCPGSGTSILRDISADLYLTGEMGHHDILDAVHSGVNVVLVNHADSERGFLPKFSEMLQSLLAFDVLVEVAQQDKDPLQTV